MKKIFFTLSFGLFLLFSFTVNAQTKFKANIENSTIKWKGFKPAGSHHGTISLKNGYFLVEKIKITGGEFIIDMNSIVNLDLDGNWNKKIVAKLKSADFFDVKKYPKAVFKITGSEQKNGKTQINGELSLKDKTNPVSFIATVNYKKEQLEVKSESFKIDRSKWNVKHKSKSFFSGLSDNFIYDDMEIIVDVVCEK
ncbi:MAG: YceI family protein [Bacteroidota bacterium]